MDERLTPEAKEVMVDVLIVFSFRLLLLSPSLASCQDDSCRPHILFFEPDRVTELLQLRKVESEEGKVVRWMKDRDEWCSEVTFREMRGVEDVASVDMIMMKMMAENGHKKWRMNENLREENSWYFSLFGFTEKYHPPQVWLVESSHGGCFWNIILIHSVQGCFSSSSLFFLKFLHHDFLLFGCKALFPYSLFFLFTTFPKKNTVRQEKEMQHLQTKSELLFFSHFFSKFPISTSSPISLSLSFLQAHDSRSDCKWTLRIKGKEKSNIPFLHV